MPQDPDLRSCVPGEGGRCQSYYPGHNTHWIHAKHVGRTPWGWRDGVVTGVDGGTLSVDYVLEEGHLRVWHHADLSAELRPGDPVRVHEEYYVLGGPFGWLNVFVRSGLGPVPTPPDPSVWDEEVTGGVQDLGTGRGLAVDWRSTDG